MTPHTKPAAPQGRPPVAAIVLEQTLGHVTHSKNLQALLPEVGGIDPVFLPVAFEPGKRRIPGWSNWTVRAGLRAGAALLSLRRRRPVVRPDVMFVHTQVPAVLLGPWMRRTPTVVSLDATPKQYDELGEFYAHEQGPAWLEQRKFRANQRCFDRAAHVVAWSGWSRRGLIDEYGIDPDRITVVAPGVDLDRWARPGARARSDGRPVRILFVGGDLHRKGGDLLIQSVRRIRSEGGLPAVELHLVTPAPIDEEAGVVVHRGLTANSPALIEQYHLADVFALPTLGDCLPMVLAEAAATGLPLVSTDVGAIHEIVRQGETGELVPPGDVDALTAAPFVRRGCAPARPHRARRTGERRPHRLNPRRGSARRLIGSSGRPRWVNGRCRRRARRCGAPRARLRRAPARTRGRTSSGDRQAR